MRDLVDTMNKSKEITTTKTLVLHAVWRSTVGKKI